MCSRVTQLLHGLGQLLRENTEYFILAALSSKYPTESKRNIQDRITIAPLQLIHFLLHSRFLHQFAAALLQLQCQEVGLRFELAQAFGLEAAGSGFQ
jgi:hypothetical protein